MEQITKYSLNLMLVATVLLTGCASNSGETKNNIEQTTVVESVNGMTKKENTEVKDNSVVVEPLVLKNEIEEENERPIYDNIPLSDELLDYTYQLAMENNISYELLLAIMSVESSYDASAISYNGSSVGLMQISRKNASWLGELVGIKNIDLTDPLTSVKLGIAHLIYTNDYWTKEGYSEEEKFWLNVVSYNRGIQGTKDWIREHGWSNSYFDKVYGKKVELEKEGM